MPYAMSRWLLRRVNRVDRQPAIFYFHPWEIDCRAAACSGIDARTRFRHYLNLDRMEKRQRELLFDFEWGRVDEILLDATERTELYPFEGIGALRHAADASLERGILIASLSATLRPALARPVYAVPNDLSYPRPYRHGATR
jgi:hypothetical protein